MSGQLKIWSDDPVVPYRSTKINFMQTKAEIDGVLARWGTVDTHWHWDPDHNDVFVQFIIKETVDDVPIKVPIRVACPVIWDHRTRGHEEKIHWNISMRCMWWFIKTHLEMAYVMQSARTVAFLPYVSAARSEDDRTVLADLILPRLEEEQKLLRALPQKTTKILDVK